MGHKKARKRKQAAAQQEPVAEPQGGRSNAHGQDPARALIAVSAGGESIAATCGNSIRVYSHREKVAPQLTESEQQHPIRVLEFDSTGRCLLAAGDDKALRVWHSKDWSLILRVVAAKRISAAAFTADGKHVVLADKFGDVLVAAVPQAWPAPEVVPDTKPRFLLGHFSSIVTALVPSEDGRWLASTDREGKARVSILPAKLEEGAPCIQSFCLGHTSFVTCAAFLDPRCLVTGSGDGSIRLWDAKEGRQLHVFDTSVFTQPRAAGNGGTEPSASAVEQVEGPSSSAGMVGKEGGKAPKAGSLEDNGHAAESSEAQRQEEALAAAEEDSGGEEEGDPGRKLEELPPAVLALAILEDRQLVAAAVEGENELFLLSVAEGRLELKDRLAIPGARLPNSLAVGPGSQLWAAGGCQGLLPLTVGCARTPDSAEAKGEDPWLPDVRSNLGAIMAEEPPTEVDHPGLQVSQELRKWVYSHEEISRRKRNRADLRDRS